MTINKIIPHYLSGLNVVITRVLKYEDGAIMATRMMKCQRTNQTLPALNIEKGYKIRNVDNFQQLREARK